ncbi:MAG: hypothetical protein MI748_00345 [Opitutales bacterium]|nr:hypothetical protein [Opitutales bacterium]
MKNYWAPTTLFWLIAICLTAQEEPIQELDPYWVYGNTVANETPLPTYANPISLLTFDASVDVQSRNFAEAQGDISIRGGTFENTGLSLGGVAIFDPQTGHYLAELPIDPQMLYTPSIRTGFLSQQSSFNATVGSIQYDWKPISVDQGSISLSFGENQLQTQSLYFAKALGENSGVDIGLSRSESDGAVEFGDHEFKRVSARYYVHNDRSEWITAFGYQDKFFGWPNMYTPFGVQETEDIQTTLVYSQFSQKLGHHRTLTLTGYYRENSDDYEFDRDRPGIFNPFQHKTKVSAFKAEFTQDFSDGSNLSLSTEFFADSIESSNLTNAFQSRTYGKLQVGYLKKSLAENMDLAINLALNDTNRDAAVVNPSVRVVYHLDDSSAQSLLYAEASRGSEVSGYTAVGSSTSGLFAGNPNLGVSRSTNYEVGYETKGEKFGGKLAGFFRTDRDLVDWTYSFSRTSARTANPVDIDTYGLIAQLNFANEKSEVVLGYTLLEKDEDYDIADVDASFYALNYANHRVTLSLKHKFNDHLKILWDNEYRIQEENPLRNSDKEATLSYLSLVYQPIRDIDWEVIFSVDNLWDDDFEDIPAVPASPRQIAFMTTYRW